MTNIVILGAGFSGVSAALELDKSVGARKDIAITVIDRHDYQLFAPNLYEVATAEEELTTIAGLKKSIAVPVRELFAGTSIIFLKASVTAINQELKTVTAGIKQIPYDYLIVALGSVSDYFGIPGAEKFALPLKTLSDALKIRNQIEFAVSGRRLDAAKKNVHIVVAGGGYTGVEFAAELSREIKYLAWKNQYPVEKIEIMVVEAMSQVMMGFSEKLSQDALWKLKNSGARVMLSSPIASVDEHFVILSSGEKIFYDVLVWTCGVRAPQLPFARPMNTDRKGRIVTNGLMQSETYHNIFAIGDCACVLNADGKPAPSTAEDAVEQGRYLGKVFHQLLENNRPSSYKGKKHGFIVTLGGKWAIMNYGGVYAKGFFAYFVRMLAHIRYYWRVLGLWKALKYVWMEWEIYGRND